jgi:D-galactonate transporter
VSSVSADLSRTAAIAAPSTRLEEDAIFSKIAWRVLPIILTAYILSFMDRINVGYTQLQMKQQLGFSDGVYGLGAGLFFITYMLLEVPSNLLFEKIGARLTFLRIMVLWGLCSAATMFVSQPWQFYTLRILLGAFEAGFFPGVILYLTYWFPSQRRARMTGFFLVGMPVTGMLGGPISGLIMSGMNGVAGYHGWQWVFLIEGLPTVLVGILLYRVLADHPRDATWLSEREKTIVQEQLALDRSGQTQTHHGRLAAALADPRTWILAFIYFTCAGGGYTLSFWLPTMVKSLGVTDLVKIGFYTVIPYTFGALGILLLGWSSDKFRERRWHVGSGLIIGGLALYLTAFLGGAFWTTIAMLCVAQFFIFGSGVLFWSIPPTYLSAQAAAAGISIISSIGILGGFVSPTLIGFMKDWTGSINGGLAFMTAVIVSGGLATLLALPERALRVGVAVAERPH